MKERYCHRCVETGRIPPGTAIPGWAPDFKYCKACRLELAITGKGENTLFSGEAGRLYGTRIIQEMRVQAQPITRFWQLASSNKKGKKKGKTLLFKP